MASSLLQDSRSNKFVLFCSLEVFSKFNQFSILDLKLMNGRKETYSEIPSIEQQSALYSYFNQASAMQLFAPQMFAPQALMSSWPFHPTLFTGGWPLTTPMPYTSPNAEFLLSNQRSGNLYLSTEKSDESNGNSEINRSNYSPFSGSDSPASQMNDSVECKKSIEKKDSPKNKVFECKVCNKTFGYKHVLQNHEKVHTGEKSFLCTKCNKRFRRDHHLKVHMRLHSGEKPYSCTFPKCDRKFAQVANLRRHSKVHEKNIAIDSKLRVSESKVDSLDLEKTSQVESNDFDFAYKTSMDLTYERPEQSEPEDLSTKTFTRIRENHNKN